MPLYIVATPIGNLEDITHRALRILKEVSLIAAEDTRHTGKLLRHYGISTPLTSYFEHNELKKAEPLITHLKNGKDIALVSDAGTPGISDPGYRLVRMAVENSVQVVSIPGPSAIVSALSIAGLPTDSFCFEGFVPSKAGERQRFFSGMRDAGKTVIVYESPNRLLTTLSDIHNILGDIEAAVGRELTKIHEEVIRGKISDILKQLSGREIKGEITLLLNLKTVAPRKEAPLHDEIKTMLKETDLTINDIAKIIAEKRGIPKREVYREALEIKEKG